MVSLVGNGPALQVTQAQPTGFLETFDDAGLGPPLPWRPAHWDITYGSQEGSTRVTQPMDAHHGPGCEPPLVDPTEPFHLTDNPLVTHAISANADTLFLCRDHVMTAISGASYAAVYLTPNQLVDFSAGEAVVRWEMSTFRQSSRDYVDFTIQPFNTNLQLTFQSGSTPRDAIHIENLNQIGYTTFRPFVLRDFARRNVGGWNDTHYEQWLVPDPARRDVFELRISRTRMSFGMPEYNRWWVQNGLIDPPLTWDQGILQLNHRSYNPTKDDADGCDEVGHCSAGTWHWDNISISPAREFSIIRANQEQADTNAPEMQFPHPAPAGAFLRFGARTSTQAGQRLQVSFNGGAWTDAQRQVVAGDPGDEWFKSYWLPVPVGTQRVRFRRADNSQSWRVRDASFWSLSTGVPSATSSPVVPSATAEPTGTPTPSPTPTAAPPTATAVVSAGPTDTPTVASSATPEPSVTPTPIVCHSAVWRGDELLHGPPVPCPI